MAQGKRPDVDGLAALAAWSGLNADDYIRSVEPRPEAEPLAKISTYLRSDRNLSPEAATALDEMIKAAYRQMRANK
jgi:LAS superfamily LD-carboxypeptidase LdcB